jgi:peptidoglycan L-alanyl-D-glutamate endopeptidase CwlK
MTTVRPARTVRRPVVHAPPASPPAASRGPVVDKFVASMKRDATFEKRFLAFGGEKTREEHIANYNALADRIGRFDDRTEAALISLVPQAQEPMRNLYKAIKAAGLGDSVKFIWGTRTYAEQDAIHAQGRTKPGLKVTNARGGQSNHNFSIAVDVGVFKDGKYQVESPLYDKVVQLSRSVSGIERGADWAGMVDRPHFQLQTGLNVGQLRAQFESGKRLVVGAN